MNSDRMWTSGIIAVVSRHVGLKARDPKGQLPSGSVMESCACPISEWLPIRARHAKARCKDGLFPLGNAVTLRQQAPRRRLGYAVESDGSLSR